jgi:hypothetical protein
VWPESAWSIAREKLAACLRAIARLLHLGGSDDGSQGSRQQREQLELEIASRLSEANSFEEQAAFEALLYGSKGSDGPNLKNATDAIEEIYVACLPWLREQRPGLTSRDGEGAKTAPAPTKTLVEAMANLMDQSHLQKADENQLPIDHLIKDEEKDLGSRVNYHSDSLEQLIGAIKEFQALASARQKV